MAGEPEFQRRLESIEELLRRIESASDPHVRSTAQELVQAVMDLHGAGFERILEILRAAGASGQSAIESLSRDDLVSSLLVLYGIHPRGMEDRLLQALDKIRPSLKKRGGEIEVVRIADGAVKLRLQASGQAGALKELVEEAVYQAAPDITSLVIEGPEDRQGFVPLDMLRTSLAGSVANGRGGL
jgi:Fe-S cluster biogenesis protein NfuA